MIAQPKVQLPFQSFVVLFASLVVCATSAKAQSEKSQPELQAGAAVVNIDPTVFPINMPGGFRANLATKIHDSFFSRALVLNSGKTTVAMVVVDNLGVDPSLIAEAKEIASKRTGIDSKRMLICSTHTHSGPSSTLEGYRDILVGGMAESIVGAHAALQPASLGVASHPLPDEVFNRRWFLKPGKMPTNPFGEMDRVKMNPSRSPAVLDRPAGPTDPDITVISVKRENGRPLSLFACYSLHYVGAIPKGQLSADYFGEFSRLMPTRIGGDNKFVAMMANGTSGDINNIPFGVVRAPRAPFEQVRVVATKAADTAWLAHQKIERFDRSLILDMRQRSVTLRYRRPNEAMLKRAQKIVVMTDERELARLPRLAVDYARRTIQAAEREEDEVEVIVQAIRVGDFVVCGLPFETLVEIGLELKQDSPFAQTMVIGLANGRHGYLPTPAQHRLGGYETWLGTNFVQKDASDILVRHLKEMLDELHD